MNKLSANQTCEYLRICKTTLNKMVKQGLKCTRINTRGDRVFSKEDIDKYLEEKNK